MESGWYKNYPSDLLVPITCKYYLFGTCIYKVINCHLIKKNSNRYLVLKFGTFFSTLKKIDKVKKSQRPYIPLRVPVQWINLTTFTKCTTFQHCYSIPMLSCHLIAKLNSCRPFFTM